MTDLLMNSMRDEMRRMRSDIETLRRRVSTGTFVSFAPALTSTGVAPDLGTGGYTLGSWTQIGGLVVVERVLVQWGTAGITAGTGTYQVALPTPAEPSSISVAVGRAFMISAAVLGYPVDTVLDSAGAVVSFMNPDWTAVSSTVPFAVGIADSMRIGPFVYRAAS